MSTIVTKCPMCHQGNVRSEAIAPTDETVGIPQCPTCEATVGARVVHTMPFTWLPLCDLVPATAQASDLTGGYRHPAGLVTLAGAK